MLDAWERGPENTPGAQWIVPPARGEDRRVVGDDYPYKAEFNTPGKEALAFGGSSKKPSKKERNKPGKSKGFKEMSRDELIEEMKAKGMTDEEISEWLETKQKSSPTKRSSKS